MFDEEGRYMHNDYTYCTRECEDMSCKHNKRHLKIEGKKVVAAIGWRMFLKCEKGVFTNEKAKEV